MNDATTLTSDYPVVSPSVGRSALRLIAQPLLIALLAALVVRSLLQAYTIPSGSMSPTLIEGDHILVTPYGLLTSKEPSRGDVIVFRLPGADEVYVKRVVGLPGEIVSGDGRRLLINGLPLDEPYLAAPPPPAEFPTIVLPARGYFVLGDNRGDSWDSRAWGTLPRELIAGRARVIFWSSAGLERGTSANAMAILPHPRRSPLRPSVRRERILQVIQ